jgi:hypothetical protein
MMRDDKGKMTCLFWKHLLHLLIGKVDLVYGVSSVLQRDVVAVDVGGEEDF